MGSEAVSRAMLKTNVSALPLGSFQHGCAGNPVFLPLHVSVPGALPLPIFPTSTAREHGAALSWEACRLMAHASLSLSQTLRTPLFTHM